tara:strand:+ start:275 stop:460 length:186 start_codon:yes stop_codon:yes gene_type:complete
MRWFFLSTDTRRFIHQTTQKKDLFFLQRAQKKSYSQLNSLFFQQEAHETEQKKRRKLFIKN